MEKSIYQNSTPDIHNENSQQIKNRKKSLQHNKGTWGKPIANTIPRY